MKTNMIIPYILFILMLELWTQVFADGSTNCFTVGSIIADSVFESHSGQILDDPEKFRKTTGTVTVKALKKYDDFESYFTAGYHGYIGKGFEAVYVDEFNKFASRTQGLKKYRLESTASRGKPWDVTDLILKKEVKSGKWKIVSRCQCKKSIKTASEALSDSKYADEIVLVPRDIYEQMKRMPKYAKYIKEGRLTCSVRGFVGVTTDYVEAVMNRVLRPVFVLGKTVPNVTISVIKLLTESEIAKSATVTRESQISKTTTIRTETQVGKTITVKEGIEVSHLNLALVAEAPETSGNNALRKVLTYSKKPLRIAGTTIEVGLGSYFIVNDSLDYQAGRLDSDIYTLKIVADSALLTPGMLCVSGKLLTWAGVSLSIPEPVSKVASITSLVAAIGLIAVDHMQEERLKEREYYFSMLEKEEKHKAVEMIIINTLQEE